MTYGGRDWRTAPGTAQQMFQVFPVMRQLHELLWYLTEALTLPAATSLHAGLRDALETTERLTRLPADELAELDVSAHRDGAAALLLRAGELERATVTAQKARRAEPTSSEPTSKRPTFAAPTSEAPTSSRPTCAAPTCDGRTSSAPTSATPT